jgi:hypothetical protein
LPDYISLAEVEVFNQPLAFETLANYAKENPWTSTSSSVYTGDTDRYGPQQANDGNRMGLTAVAEGSAFWGYSAPDNTTTNADGTLVDPQPWWQVDLPAEQTVGSVVLWPRRDRVLTRFLNIKLQLLNSSAVVVHEHLYAVQPSGPKYVLNFAPAIAGVKTVRISTTDATPDKFLNLPEVEVFAPLASALPITIVSNLQPLAVEQNRVARIGPVVASVDGGIRPEEISYRWYRNGVEMPGIAGSWISAYTTPYLVGLTNNGDTYKVQVSVPGHGVFSSEVALSVYADTNAPVVVTNYPSISDAFYMNLIFSEALDPATATNAANYYLDGGPTVGPITLNADGKTVQVTVLGLLPGDSVALHASGVKDLAGNTMVPALFNAPYPATEVNYARAGTATQSSTTNGGIPSRANDGNTSGNWGSGSVIHTGSADNEWWEVDLKAPKQIGLVRVWIRTDCCNDRAQNLDLVIYDTNTVSRVEVLRIHLTTTGTIPNPIVADLGAGMRGQVVRIEHPAGIAAVLNLAEVQVIPPPMGLLITSSPKSWNVYAGDRVFLRSGAIGQTPIGLQWQHNGLPIPGATGTELVITNITAELAGTYVCVATNAVRTRSSPAATVMVNPRPDLVHTLVARYLFTADGSTNVVDDAPFGFAKTVSHDGANAGATWVASVTDGTSVTRTGVMQFDPTLGNQQVAIPPHVDLDSPIGTIAFWMNATPPASKAGVFDRRGGTNNYGDVLILNENSSDSPNKLPGTMFDQAYPSGLNVGGNAPLNDQNWHHFTYVYTWQPIGIVSFYVDGVLDAELTQGAAGAWPADRPLEFGQSHDGYWPAYTGYLDDIHIFNRTLSAVEINQLMTNGVPPLPPTLYFSVAGNQVTITWLGAGYILQQSGNLSNATGWADLGGATSSPVTIPLPTTGNNFYRLKKQ